MKITKAKVKCILDSFFALKYTARHNYDDAVKRTDRMVDYIQGPYAYNKKKLVYMHMQSYKIG